MAALSSNRNTQRQGVREQLSLPVKASTHIYEGSIVCVDASGYAVPASTSTTLICMGVALAEADNSSGASGDLSVQVSQCVAKMDNSTSSDQIVQAEVGSNCYLVDDHTLAKTNGTSTRSAAGKVVRIDADGSPWVYLGLF